MPHATDAPPRNLYELVHEALHKLDYIAALILTAHREEMKNTDEEALRLRLQLSEIVTGLGDEATAEQVARLKQLAARLTQIGESAAPPTNPS